MYYHDNDSSNNSDNSSNRENSNIHSDNNNENGSHSKNHYTSNSIIIIIIVVLAIVKIVVINDINNHIVFGGINTDLTIVKISCSGIPNFRAGANLQQQALYHKTEICKPQLQSPSHYMPPNKSFEIREAHGPRP